MEDTTFIPKDPGSNIFEGRPSHKQQSWGTLIAIIVIVLMVVVGALYAWGKRIADRENIYSATVLEGYEQTINQ